MVKKHLIGILRIFLYLLAVFLLSFHLFGISLNFSNINSFFINKIFAGKLSYEGISFRQSLKGIDINLENFNYDGDIKVEGQNLFLKLNLLNSFLSKEVYIDFLFIDEASIRVNPSNERRNIINFFVKEGSIKKALLGKANIESLNIANFRTEGRRFGFTFKESSISLDNALKNISGFSGIASYENQKLKLLIDSNIALFNLDIYQEERVLSDLRGLLSLDFNDKFKILPSFLNAETANSQQFFNINFDKALKLNVLTLGDSGDIYYWAPSNLATNDFFRQSNIFSEDVKSIFSLTLLNDNRSLSGKILLSNPKIPFLPRNFDINYVEMNVDNFKVDALANGTLPFTDSENLYIDYSFAEEVFKASFLDDFKDPFSISFDNKGSVSAINGSLKPNVGAGYHINFFDNQVFVNSDLLQLKFLFSKNLNIFADNYLFEISKIDSNLFAFEQEYPSSFNFDLSNLSVKNLNTKFYVNYSNYIKENFPNLTFEKFSIETKNISANISSNSLEFFGNFLVDGEDIKYSDTSFDFDALRVLSLIDLRTSFSSFLNLNFDKYERDSFYVDQLDGEMLIQGNNLINISNLELDFGPAKADINGTIATDSLLYDTYDLNLDFTTKISQALPWYVAIFGGIPAAAGAALVTGILDDNINEITKTSYKIKGNNNNLEVLNN